MHGPGIKGIKENTKVYKEYFDWNENNIYSDSRKYEGLSFSWARPLFSWLAFGLAPTDVLTNSMPAKCCARLLASALADMP